MPVPSGDIVAGLGIPAMRYELLRHLRDGDLTVTQLMGRTGLSRSGVCKHLRELTRAGIVARVPKRMPHSTRPVDVYRLDASALASGLERVAAGS